MTNVKRKIGEHQFEYEIIEVSMNDMPSNCLGFCDSENQEILILKKLPFTRKRQVLSHELCHAYIYENGLSNDNDTFTEEEVCQVMSVYGETIWTIVNEVYNEEKNS